LYATIDTNYFSINDNLLLLYAMEQFIELQNLQTSIFTLVSHSTTRDLHKHETAQLSVPQNGIIYFMVEGQLYMIPPNTAIYIPANIHHCIYKTNNKIIIENIYFSKKYFDLLPQITRAVTLTDLAKILIERLCKISKDDLDNNKTQQMLELLLDELKEINNKLEFNLKIPQNEGLRQIFNHVANNESANLPNLESCASAINVSPRSLQRIIKQELGISFILWRGQILFMKSLELIHKHKSTSIVSYMLGYNSESAFISMFKKFSHGKTPSDFY
jgi:AraC-like DNA-binding protein